MCVCTWKSACMYVCGCVYMFVCVYVCISVCMHACTCVCMCMCACMGPSAFAYLFWLAVGKKSLLQSFKNRIRIRTRTHFSSSKDLVLGLKKVSCHFSWVFILGDSSFGSEASYPDKDAMCKQIVLCFCLWNKDNEYIFLYTDNCVPQWKRQWEWPKEITKISQMNKLYIIS